MTRFMIRRLEETGVSPLGNLVKGRDRHVVAEGDQLLAEVREQGRRAHDAAVEQGRRHGEAEGRKRAAALMADTVAAAQGQLRASERRLIAIVMEAVRRIIGEFEDTELTSRLVRKLVAEAERQGRIRLRVSPGQLTTVRDLVRRMPNRPGEVELVEVIADPSVDDRACRMETELGFVETSIDAQLEVLQAALENYPVESRAP